MKKIIKWAIIGFVVISLFPFFFGKKPDNEDNKMNKENAQNQIETANNEKTELPKYAPSDEEINKMALDYCRQRADKSRVYPIPVKSDTDDKQEYKIVNESRKPGSSLTQNDCYSIINYLVWFKNYSTLVMTIDISSIIESKYWIGMNVAELMSSLGWPDDINTTNVGGDKTEQWIYYKDSHRINGYYFYIESSKVTSYQDY